MPLTLTPATTGLLYLDSLVGTLTSGGVPEVSNGGQVATPIAISLKDGSVASPKTSTKYTTPVLYIERYTNSVVPTGYVFWGNARKTAPLVVEVVGGAAESGEVNGIATRVQSTGNPQTGQAGNVAISALAQTSTASGLNRDCFGANFIAMASGSGTAPGILCGIEVDLTSTISMTSTVRPGQPTENRWVGYMASATGVTMNTGLWVTSFDGANTGVGPGWQFGMVIEAFFYQWAGFLRNSLTTTGAGGLYVEIHRANSDTLALQVTGPGGTQLQATGDTNNPISMRIGGNLINLQPQGAVTNTHTVAAGSTTSVFTNTTFDGGLGSTGFTVGDVVRALKNLGLLSQ